MFKLALVTGATSGIGLALSELLAKKGIPLILTGRDQKKLEELSQRLKAKVFSANLDQPEGVILAVAHIRQHKPDLVINNAGLGFYGEAISIPASDQDLMIDVNVKALTVLTLAAAESMVKNKQKGTILNVSSVAPYFPSPGYATYSATKAYVNSFSESMDYELMPQNVRVLTACPGSVQTQFSSRASKGKQEGSKDDAIKLSAEETAEEMWTQIEKGQQTKIIN